MCRLSALPQGQHDTEPCFSWNRSPASVPALIFTSFFPTDTRPAQFCRVGVAAKARWREKALKSHFMKHPCSRRPSHAAQAADFPFSTHPTQRLGGLGTAGPCSRRLGAPGSWNSRGWHRRALGSRPRFWHLPQGPQLAVVTAETG